MVIIKTVKHHFNLFFSFKFDSRGGFKQSNYCNSIRVLVRAFRCLSGSAFHTDDNTDDCSPQTTFAYASESFKFAQLEEVYVQTLQSGVQTIIFSGYRRHNSLNGRIEETCDMHNRVRYSILDRLLNSLNPDSMKFDLENMRNRVLSVICVGILSSPVILHQSLKVY